MASSKKAVFTLFRVYIKKGISAGTIVYKVRSVKTDGSQADYLVTLNVNGAHSCQCEGHTDFHKTCCHIKHAVAQEAARTVATSPAPTASTNLDELTVEQISALRIEGERKQKELSRIHKAEYNARLKAIKAEQRRETAPIQSHAFSILKSA